MTLKILSITYLLLTITYSSSVAGVEASQETGELRPVLFQWLNLGPGEAEPKRLIESWSQFRGRALTLRQANALTPTRRKQLRPRYGDRKFRFGEPVSSCWAGARNCALRR